MVYTFLLDSFHCCTSTSVWGYRRTEQYIRVKGVLMNSIEFWERTLNETLEQYERWILKVWVLYNKLMLYCREVMSKYMYINPKSRIESPAWWASCWWGDGRGKTIGQLPWKKNMTDHLVMFKDRPSESPHLARCWGQPGVKIIRGCLIRKNNFTSLENIRNLAWWILWCDWWSKIEE